MSKPTLYGIKNCDSVRKARKFLDAHNIAYDFYDLRADGISQQLLKSWCTEVDWELLLNRRSTTFKQLDPATKLDIDESRAINLMHSQPTLIKRPVLQWHGAQKQLMVGFNNEHYEHLIGV